MWISVNFILVDIMLCLLWIEAERPNDKSGIPIRGSQVIMGQISQRILEHLLHQNEHQNCIYICPAAVQDDRSW